MRGLSALGLRSILALAMALASLLTAAPALAWTDATVRSAHAEVQLTDDGRAHVTLWARVRVDGGWLEGMELEGLDEDLTLDAEHPLTFRDANGVSLPVEVTPRDGGRVSLRFARRSAPRRGEYDIQLAWTTSLTESRALDADTIEARWIFPAWRFGLDGVEVRWVVPRESQPQPDDEITAPIETETQPVLLTSPLGSVERDAEHVAIVYRRAHLPRTSDWDSTVHVPRAAWPHPATLEPADSPLVAAAPSGRAVSSTAPSRAVESPAADDAWLALTLFIAVGATLKRRDLDRRARRARQVGRFLLGTPAWLHLVLALATAVLAITVHALGRDASLDLIACGAIVAITWQRSAMDPPRPRAAMLTPIGTRERLHAERALFLDWLAPSALVEPTRLGLVSSAVALTIAIQSDAIARLLAALFVALVVSGSRARLADSSVDAVRRLSSAMRVVRADLAPPYIALRLLGRGAVDPTDPRIHVALSDEGARARLLQDLRVEIVAAAPLALRIAAREETAADLALRAWAESRGVAVHDISRRRAVLVPVTAREVGVTLERVVRDILALAPREQDATLREDDAPGAALLDAAE